MGLLSRRSVFWVMVTLTVVLGTVALWAMYVLGRFMPGLAAPPAALLICLIAWPFLQGWRPFVSTHAQFRPCPACGTVWRPAEEGTFFCPACGTQESASGYAN